MSPVPASAISFERGARLITGMRTTLEPDWLGRPDDDLKTQRAELRMDAYATHGGVDNNRNDRGPRLSARCCVRKYGAGTDGQTQLRRDEGRKSWPPLWSALALIASLSLSQSDEH